MRWGRNHAVKNEKEIGTREWFLSCNWSSESPHAAGHGTRDDQTLAVMSHFREERFQLPAYARQVRVDRIWFDMTRKEDYVER